jgi:hypothetical protein
MVSLRHCGFYSMIGAKTLKTSKKPVSGSSVAGFFVTFNPMKKRAHIIRFVIPGLTRDLLKVDSHFRGNDKYGVSFCQQRNRP